jgi:hypothetical protein
MGAYLGRSAQRCVCCTADHSNHYQKNSGKVTEEKVASSPEAWKALPAEEVPKKETEKVHIDEMMASYETM